MKQSQHVYGLFEIAIRKTPGSNGPERYIILACRGGRLFGADYRGRIYSGSLKARRALRGNFLRAVCERHRLKARQRIGAASSAIRIPISGEIDLSAPRQTTIVYIGGKPVDIEITHLGPLPQENTGPTIQWRMSKARNAYFSAK